MEHAARAGKERAAVNSGQLHTSTEGENSLLLRSRPRMICVHTRQTLNCYRQNVRFFLGQIGPMSENRFKVFKTSLL